MSAFTRVIHDSGLHQQLHLIDTQFIPALEADAILGSADIISIVISNQGGQQNPKFTLKDKQAVPKVFVFGVNTPVPAGAVVMFGPGPGMRATGGLTWVCDTASALTCKIEYRRP
jgi:hypothetical protein